MSLRFVSLMLRIILYTAINSIRILQRNRLQAGLTMLGILIGVGAVIMIVGIGHGARSAVQAQVASIGANVIIIMPGATTVGGVRTGLGGAATLTIADAIEIKKRVPLLREVSWIKRKKLQVVNGGRNWSVNVYGTTPGFFSIREWPVASGTAFTEADVESAVRVAVLGQTVVENLFDSGEEPVGAVIRISHVPFRVIGVLAAKGQSAEGADQDDSLYIPFQTAERKVFGTQFFSGLAGAVLAATDREDDLRPAVDEIREVLRERHRLGRHQLDDFTIRTQVDIAEMQEGTSQTLMVMLLVIASVSLLVGGIGIMNILLVSVTQRTKEIGVRMAVGATRYHILVQFLSEAVILSLAGSILGVFVGIAGTRLITMAAGWPASISPEAIVIAVVLSAGMGLFFGMYPAHKAAQLNPIEALRYE